MNGKKRKVFDVAAAECWQCCGYLIAAGAKCPKCGKSKSGNNLPGVADTEPEQAAFDALGESLKTAQKVSPIAGKLRITITRGTQGRQLDHDNFVGGCKPLRDEIARLLGRDDAEQTGIDWRYIQTPSKTAMVEIEKIGD
ncbi:MAG: hypothetical protein RR415_08880 [Ruthenibacterium sp.]